MFLFFPQNGQVFLRFLCLLLLIFVLNCQVFFVILIYLIYPIKKTRELFGFAWGLGFIGGLLALFLSFVLFDLDSEGIRKINILVGVWFFFLYQLLYF